MLRVLHHYNTKAHIALPRKYNIPVMDQPPYLPDLKPCDFYLFLKVSSALKGTRFQIIETLI